MNIATLIRSGASLNPVYRSTYSAPSISVYNANKIKDLNSNLRTTS